MRSTQLTTKLTLPISIRVRGDGCFDANEQNLYLQLIVNTLTRRGGTVGVEKNLPTQVEAIAWTIQR
ncbi:hypothetical protein QUA20_27420 [Microcoleus sp. Pol7_A1]|uniref:hypothetical protein n=1 Tax=Microcoleus sp. Pol7_A1 TaxID=2818893 RepID=UPI002FD60C32